MAITLGEALIDRLNKDYPSNNFFIKNKKLFVNNKEIFTFTYTNPDDQIYVVYRLIDYIVRRNIIVV